jgi:hypothetical protein
MQSLSKVTLLIVCCLHPQDETHDYITKILRSPITICPNDGCWISTLFFVKNIYLNIYNPMIIFSIL